MTRELSTQQSDNAIQVRDVQLSDVPQLVLLINALNVHEGTAQTMTVQHAEYMLFSPSRPIELQCLVAVKGRTVTGFVLFYQGYDTASTSYGFHIADIFVDIAHRRHGIGETLMARVASRCLEQGGQWCSLTTARNNHGADAFYEACGCHAQPVVFRAIGGGGLQALYQRVVT